MGRGLWPDPAPCMANASHGAGQWGPCQNELEHPCRWRTFITDTGKGCFLGAGWGFPCCSLCLCLSQCPSKQTDISGASLCRGRCCLIFTSSSPEELTQLLQPLLVCCGTHPPLPARPQALSALEIPWSPKLVSKLPSVEQKDMVPH